jgi:acetyltransferase
MYMETIGNARRFLSAAREVALTKPIIVIKAGRTAAAAKAAASHTGSLAGSDDVLDAAFRRVGVLRVDRIADIFYMAEVLAKQPRAAGPRLTIVTNAGGPGVLATDALITSGGKLTQISDETMEELNAFLPAAWSHNNPVDILGDASPERYAKTLEVAANNKNSDGTAGNPDAAGHDRPDADRRATAPGGRPSWGASRCSPAGWAAPMWQRARRSSTAPAFPPSPIPTRRRGLQLHVALQLQLEGIYETPSLPSCQRAEAMDRTRARQLIDEVRKKGRTILTEYESKQIFNAYGIPTVETRLAATADDAVREAEDPSAIPVVLKLNSETITHKTDVKGVQLNLRTRPTTCARLRRRSQRVGRETRRRALPGRHRAADAQAGRLRVDHRQQPDPQFGPVLLFGTGGTLVEVYKDRALACRRSTRRWRGA